ncbi:hydrogenase expression/formation protein HypE [bacterium]|nr:MAG: hydrogenase expression/formation protein HypE [bacterium]
MDKILLSHGGGGKLTRKLEELYLRYFENEKLRELDDGAIFDGYAISTDSFVVNPIFFPGGDIGKLSVCGTVNDLVSMGAKPVYLSLSFILEEGFLIQDLERILSSIRKTCDEAGVEIVTGDTKVVERGKGDGIYINTTGIGKVVMPELSRERIKPGDLILVNGPIGMHGISVMVAREKLGIGGKIESDCAPLTFLLSLSPGVKFMRDPTRGGVASVLNEVVKGMEWGVVINQEQIPVTPEVSGVCELLGIDVLTVACEGRMLLFVEREKADEVLQGMRRHPLGKESTIIGEVVDEPGVVLLKTPFGTHRRIEPPPGESLPRIC